MKLFPLGYYRRKQDKKEGEEEGEGEVHGSFEVTIRRGSYY